MTTPITIDNSTEPPVPRLSDTGRSVGNLVQAAYADGLDAALLAAGGSTPAGLRAAIDYCADEACIGDGAFCPGCRKLTDAQGLASLDQFVRRFESVSFQSSGLVLRSDGPLPQARFESLDQLAQDWQGAELWYLARRVVRRIKKQTDPRPKRMSASSEPEPAPALVLVRPQLADNIGMVARAMANFGLDDLRLVDPRDGWPNEKARAAASGANHVVDEGQSFPRLEDAIADVNWVCATTARQRDLAKPVMTPEQAVAEMNRRLGQGQRCAMLFGPERAGLETDEVALADAIVMVPVNPRFASLNLAQAVLLLGYEWLKQSRTGTLGRVTTYEEEIAPGLNRRGSPPATKAELLGFFEHIEGELERMGFFNPPHKRQTVVRNLRSMFARMSATEQEVRTLRGIVATLVRGKGAARKPPPQTP